ncbi:hypothetical protein FLA_3442 [Filimonas lacunae]|nr:hypothetical protein FLA_3442 [Filimonas lacunae]
MQAEVEVYTTGSLRRTPFFNGQQVYSKGFDMHIIDKDYAPAC